MVEVIHAVVAEAVEVVAKVALVIGDSDSLMVSDGAI